MKRFAPTLLMIILAGCMPVRHSGPMATRVAKLVDNMTLNPKLQVLAFEKLEAMGDAAVPHLIAHLDDLRPLAVDEISLHNKSPDAFEGMRHYQPKVVHDAISAILNQITGETFMAVYNGATDEQRKQNHSMWVSWCHDRFPHSTSICSGSTDLKQTRK